MTKGKKRHDRKARRWSKQVLKSGGTMRPKHRSRSGRTGSVLATQHKEKAK